MSFSRLVARMLLDQCRGDEIWPVDYCRAQGIPESWIEELADCIESGFRRQAETIYTAAGIVNQFHGVRDRDLAFRLAEYLGVDSVKATEQALGPLAEVRALKATLEEG